MNYSSPTIVYYFYMCLACLFTTKINDRVSLPRLACLWSLRSWQLQSALVAAGRVCTYNFDRRCADIVYVNVQFKVHMCMAVPFVHGLRKFEGERADARDATGVSLNKVSLTQICVNGG